MFEGFFDALASVLNFFYTLIPNYGIAIMLLTVLVMALITPLTVKSTRSMLQMQRMQPEMKRIQAKYKNDREKLNEELMKFYRENQINPLGGCLPILAQMPVFIIMYQLLRGLTVRQGGLGSGVGSIGAQIATGVPQAKLQPWIYTDQFFRPLHLNRTTELYQALSHTTDMNFFGMDLSISAAQALRISVITVIPYLALLLVMLGTGIYQNRQLQARNTSASVNPQQQMLMKVMPFFLPVFAWAFPAGLALYWCTQNFCRIGTNAYITRSVYRKEHQPIVEATAREAKDADGDADSGGSGKAVGAGGAKGGGKGGGKASGKGGAGVNGRSKAGAGKAPSANGKGSDERSPGKSVKSQKAAQNAAGRRPSGAARPSGRGSGRRSGEPRRRNER